MQPLSLVHPNAAVCLGTEDAMTSRPDIAIKISECIAEWAEIETLLGLVLSFLLSADAKTALAIYTAVENRAAQHRMLEAAAKSKLETPHSDVLLAVLIGFVRPAMKERDKLAHWCWGYSPRLMDALLLIEPEVNMRAKFSYSDPAAYLALRRDRIFVVKKNDLTRMLGRLRTAKSYVGRFIGTLWPKTSTPRRAQLLQTLSNEPPIQKALTRIRANRKKTPEVLQQSLQSEETD